MTFLPSGVLKNNLPRPWSKAKGDPPSSLITTRELQTKRPCAASVTFKICWSNSLEKSRLG